MPQTKKPPVLLKTTAPCTNPGVGRFREAVLKTPSCPEAATFLDHVRTCVSCSVHVSNLKAVARFMAETDSSVCDTSFEVVEISAPQCSGWQEFAANLSAARK